MSIRIEGGNVLLPDGVAVAAVSVAGDAIEAIDGRQASRRIDARGLSVLPGIVDLHGDAFERQIQPRPGVAFAADIALADTEAQLLSNGITTAFHAVTLSWEPGLRSPEAWRTMLDAMARYNGACDMRVHMRWELHNLDALEMALQDIVSGQVGMVAFNDHTPSILRKLATTAGAAKYSERAMMSVDAFRALAERAIANEPLVADGARRIAAAARSRNLPMASHDDDLIETREHYRTLGATICEFPMAEDVGVAASQAGEAVVMGSPNVVRGGSHLGWASAASLAERGVCTTLVSDYYYPAMLRAGLHLAEGPLGLAGAWSLISQNPARAAGLMDRGWIGVGARADLVVVDPVRKKAVATIAGGRVAHLTAEGWSRLS